MRKGATIKRPTSKRPTSEFPAMDYYAHSKNAGEHFEKLAAFQPRTLAVMHGSAWQGDGGALLRELGRSVEA
jgi:hypothetical protein